MEGQENNSTTTAGAPTSAPEPRVLSNSLSASFQAGDSGGDSKTADFDDIFAPPETAVPGAAPSKDEPKPGATEEPPPPPDEEEEPDQTEATLEALAAEHGLDPANAKHRALLEQLASGMAAGSAQEGAGAADDDELLSEYEKSLLAPAQPQQGQAPRQLPPPLPPGKFGDILDSTNTAAEAWDMYRDVWTPDENGEIDVNKANAVMNGIFVRQFWGMAMPHVHQAIAAHIQSQLGDAVHYVRQYQDGERRNEIYTDILQNLKKEKGYENIEDLFKPLSDKKIKVGPDTVDDNQINRTLRRYPEILDIHRYDPDPEKALRLTQLARLRSVVRHNRNDAQSVKVPTARALVAAGAQIEQKKTSDASRQRLNSGPGATGAGSPGSRSADDRFMDAIVNANGGPVMRVGHLLRGGR